MWALHPRAHLVIPTPNTRQNLALLVDITPALAEPELTTRTMAVSVRGMPALHISSGDRSTYYIPCGRFEPQSTLEVVFDFDSAFQSFQGESRPLAFMFHSVRLISEPDYPTIEPVTLPPVSALETITPELIEREVGTPIAEFVMEFESLGHSCDFGIFQRQCGAEPLGLLRFAGISTSSLVNGIADRFMGLEEPTKMDAILIPEWGDEYRLVEGHYGINSHTHLGVSDASPEQLIARERWRLPFLRRMFLEVLDGKLKTFVLRRPAQMHVSEAQAVVAALRLWGENHLLWAVQHQGGEPGAVDQVLPYLMRGHLDTTRGPGNATMEAWLSVCVNARTLRSRITGI